MKLPSLFCEIRETLGAVIIQVSRPRKDRDNWYKSRTRIPLARYAFSAMSMARFFDVFAEARRSRKQSKW